MIRATSITTDVPGLGLRARDVILEEDDAPHQVVLYRALPLNYKLILARLVAQGSASPCDLADADDLLESSGDGVPGRRRTVGAGPRLQLVP